MWVEIPQHWTSTPNFGKQGRCTSVVAAPATRDQCFVRYMIIVEVMGEASVFHNDNGNNDD